MAEPLSEVWGDGNNVIGTYSKSAGFIINLRNIALVILLPHEQLPCGQLTICGSRSES